MSTKFAVSCPDCPFEGTYRTDAIARRALTQHSCEWQHSVAARKARGAARRAVVDRTPKPCLHKKANHQHGTRACYVLDRCRCLPCSDANKTSENERYRLKAYGRYESYVDAEPARHHLRDLVDRGMGPKRIAEVSGIAHGVVTALLYGKWLKPGQTRWQKRIARDTAQRILAVEFNPAGPVLAPTDTTTHARRQLQALVALGWSISQLGRRLHTHRANMTPLINTDRPMHWSTVRKIDRLYTELSNTQPPQTTAGERGAVTRARAYAKAHDWLLPIELDLVDDPVEPIEDGLDEIAIERRMAGNKTIRLTKAESAELVRRWRATGRSNAECERVTGIQTYRYKKEQNAA